MNCNCAQSEYSCKIFTTTPVMYDDTITAHGGADE
ncbi:hypothetical protein BAAA27672_03075 [Bifidobacterium animalis subsp. animalis ATCC 27672]|nr:hypothetical protein BAAA27672_03075 [Bifidobacterium animalis subsp. animalis ATCC 27672]